MLCGSISGLSLQRTRCYSAVVVILSVTARCGVFRLRTECSRRWHALWVLVAFLLPQPVHATLYVIVLDKQGIAIASDGSRTLYTRGELLPVSKTVEKVTKLGSKLAFMCSGLVEIETATVDIRPSEIAS